VLEPLRAEGLTDLEVIGVFTNGSSWDAHNPGFDEVTFPMLLDPQASVFYLYGTTSYDLIFVDRKQRLVNKETFDTSLVPSIKQRLRELHAE
jgi:hypothetical protein